MNVRRELLKKRDAEIELLFLESIGRRIHGDLDIQRALAEMYTETGRYEQGLRMDMELSRVCPADPLSWYNLGCSFSLVGRKEEAIEALGKSLEVGYDDYDWMKRDPDLAAVRDDPRFESMLSWLYGEDIEEDEFFI